MRGVWRFKKWLERRRERASLRVAESAVERFPMVANPLPHRLPFELIVSLTSYPKRYGTLAKTLKSLLDQTIAADRTILWIAYDDVDALPAEVRLLAQHGLEIRLCTDLGSYKKLVPSLIEYPEAAIVTADDDLYYPPDWLQSLADAAAQDPTVVIAHRCHIALLNNDGTLCDYDKWSMDTSARSEGDGGLLFPTGGAGVLYPPHLSIRLFHYTFHIRILFLPSEFP